MSVIKNSESRAWNEFVEGYYALIVRYAYQFLGNLDDAYDAAQDTFLKAFRNRGKIGDRLQSDESRFWIYRICRNVCTDRARWWKRYFSFKSKLDLEDSPPTDDIFTLSIKQELSQLPQKQREVFILRHWHGFSTKETSGLLGISEGTVKSHLTRAVGKLKRNLKSVEGYR